MTYEQESQLRQIVGRFVEAVANRGASLPKIKLVKLIYLLDLEAYRERGYPITGLDWQFHHYGPYTQALEPALDRAEGLYFNRIELSRQQQSGLASTIQRLGETPVPTENEVVYLFTPIRGQPEEPIADSYVANLVDRVAQHWAAATTDAILTFVYATEPIGRGHRYEPLNWNLATRDSGPFVNQALYFSFSPRELEAIANEWADWQKRRLEHRSRYDEHEWLFDHQWFSALERMDQDEGKPVTVHLRVQEPLPQRQAADD